MNIQLDERDRVTSLDQAAAVFVDARSRLFGIAYRMLGGSAEAEDIVQETWLRWQDAEHAVIANPGAFLALITTRLSINAARSARVRHETGIGPRTPEPVDLGADPAAGAERADAVERALLLLLETLTPAQRAAYILREAFDYPYARIAELVRLSPANVRQLVSRARRQLSAPRRGPVRAGEHRRLLSAFLEAAQDGNVRALEELLAADVGGSSGDSPVLRREPTPAQGVVRSRALAKCTVPGPGGRRGSAQRLVPADART
ncbi:sigma-70 family RNA polymerase sigma factor [Actinomadura nitritigenes]|uniref:sigma-70 family RNA polymerase sigma factor n=1 Tax=Actinomadura nitritigenes TaxID=134602 RepID=UPI003D8CC2EC